jgi:hypothetical protein
MLRGVCPNFHFYLPRGNYLGGPSTSVLKNIVAVVIIMSLHCSYCVIIIQCIYYSGDLYI